MKYQKGDIINGYKILLPLKKADGKETYRVRSGEGLLCAMKFGISENERHLSPNMELYLDSGEDYVVYRYISGETLESRMTRGYRHNISEVKVLALNLLEQLVKIHEKGYVHNGISPDNVIIDMLDGTEKAWLTGYSSMTKSENATEDIRSIGTIMYRMIFGEMPENPPRMRNLNISGLDDNLLNTLHNALVSEISSSREMIACISGYKQIEAVRKPSGPGFSAVAGMEEIKRRLQEDVIDILSDKEEAARYGIEISNGMLLYGPPGCGKTFIAERFAEQAGYNYRYVKSSDLASTYIHGSQEKIAELFDEARRNSPTILCFDEFDALVPKRDDVNNASQSAEVNEFLTQLNNCGRDDVFVIATTNRPDRIDSAVLRTGRIDYLVYVPVPDKNAREEMFRLGLAGKPMEASIDYESLSGKTEDYLSSDISAIVRDAARMAFRDRCNISMQHLLSAIAGRKPSLTKAAIAEYEAIRQKVENENTSIKRIGFK